MTDNEDDAYDGWIEHHAIEPMLAYMQPSTHEGIEFRRYEYGYLDVVRNGTVDDIPVEGICFGPELVDRLQSILEIVDRDETDNRIDLFPGDIDEVYIDEESVYVHRHVYLNQSFFEDTEGTWPVLTDFDNDELELPRELVPELLQFINDTDELYEFDGRDPFEDALH